MTKHCGLEKMSVELNMAHLIRKRKKKNWNDFQTTGWGLLPYKVSKHNFKILLSDD